MQNRLKLFTIVKSFVYAIHGLNWSFRRKYIGPRERPRFPTDFYYNVCKQTIYFRLITRCFNISSIKPNMTLNKSTFIADTTAQKYTKREMRRIRQRSLIVEFGYHNQILNHICSFVYLMFQELALFLSVGILIFENVCFHHYVIAINVKQYSV